MLEEDESEILAQQMQNESFGGVPNNNINSGNGGRPMVENR